VNEKYLVIKALKGQKKKKKKTKKGRTCIVERYFHYLTKCKHGHLLLSLESL
jgi:hypothetical protein